MRWRCRISSRTWLSRRVAAILLVNEVPDIRADAAAGKNTLVVRLGVPATRRLYAGIQLAAIVTFIACGVVAIIPWWDRARLTRAIETTLALHLSGSLLLVCAVLVARFVTP